MYLPQWFLFKKQRKTLPHSRIRTGHVSTFAERLTTQCVAGDVPWTIQEVAESIGGDVGHQRWSLKLTVGSSIIEGAGVGNRTIRDLFIAVFPADPHLPLVSSLFFG